MIDVRGCVYLFQLKAGAKSNVGATPSEHVQKFTSSLANEIIDPTNLKFIKGLGKRWMLNSDRHTQARRKTSNSVNMCQIIRGRKADEGIEKMKTV